MRIVGRIINGRYIPRAELRRARKRFLDHSYRAKGRGVPFLLTFEEWFHIWKASGHWHESGTRRGQYNMARYGDKGGYEVGNVRIITAEENVAEAWRCPERQIQKIQNRVRTQKLWQDPDYRAKQGYAISVGVQQLWKDPEFRAKKIAASAENTARLWQDPEWRAKQIAALKRAKQSAITSEGVYR